MRVSRTKMTMPKEYQDCCSFILSMIHLEGLNPQLFLQGYATIATTRSRADEENMRAFRGNAEASHQKPTTAD